jgi:TrmH family RNA methyltransferase
MITSPDNTQLKLIRKLQRKKARDETGLFAAEGEDLVEAAEVAGWEAEVLLRSAVGAVTPQGRTPHSDVEPELLDRVSSLGSGSRVVGIYRQRWVQPRGELSVYLHGVGDQGNVGAVIRSAHALCDGPVILGPGCADPFSPKAVRASMGSIFARPPARSGFGDLSGAKVALDARAAIKLGAGPLAVEAPLVLCVGAEREGLPPELAAQADLALAIPLRDGGPESLNAAMAATVGLYELANRMAADV